MHPNADVVMRGFQAFAEGDMETLKSLFAADATWHSAGRNKWSGDYTGPDAIVEMMSSLSGEADVKNHPHAVLADDDHVVVLNSSSMTRDGRTFDGDTVFVFHVGDGTVNEAWTIPGDAYGLDEFWAD